MEIAIITSEAVDKTFEGTDCLLKRTIVSSSKENGEKRYIIRTERCNYVDKEQQVFGEDGQPELDENNNRVFETVQALKVINKKDDDFVQKFTYKEIEADDALKPIVKEFFQSARFYRIPVLRNVLSFFHARGFWTFDFQQLRSLTNLYH